MATITETGVVVEIEVRRDDDGSPFVAARARSVDSNGETVRRTNRDITDQLSAARLAGISDLIADVEQRVKAMWEIS